MDEEQEQDQ